MTPVLVLVGPPTSGKTTVGTAVAELLGVAFRDTDADVEQVAGASVSDIFVDSGEPHFRALEEQAVARAMAEHPGVLALGGGAVMSAATRELLVRYRGGGGTVVWLDVDLASAANRAGFNRDRPLLLGNPRAMLRALLAERAPLYAEVATLSVPTGGREPGDVVAEVAAAVSAKAGAGPRADRGASIAARRPSTASEHRSEERARRGASAEAASTTERGAERPAGASEWP